MYLMKPLKLDEINPIYLFLSYLLMWRRLPSASMEGMTRDRRVRAFGLQHRTARSNHLLWRGQWPPTIPWKSEACGVGCNIHGDHSLSSLLIGYPPTAAAASFYHHDIISSSINHTPTPLISIVF